MRSLTWIVIACWAAACDESGTAAPTDTARSDSDAAPDTAADSAPADTTVADADVTPDSGPLVPPGACASLLPECLGRSRTCVVEDGEPTCRGCTPGEFPRKDDGACVPLTGVPLLHDFGEQTLEGGQEIGSLCQSWMLDNDEELWVNAVEMDNDGHYHHSNWVFVPEDHKGWPTGPWLDCYDEGFHELDAAIAGGVLYAQSTQVKRELQKFTPGAAVHIPPRSRIITVTHLLNYLPTPVTTGLRLTIWTLPRAAVTIPLTPAQLVYGDLAIPKQAISSFGSTCDLAAKHADLFGADAPFALKLHYVLPHYHALGAGFELQIVGGPRDGETIVDLGAFSADPFGFTFEPPIDMTGATGLRFACRFDNPRDKVVRWGIGDQEMCEALLFFESPFAFSAGVGETGSRTTEDGVEVFTGPCDVLGFPFNPLD